MRTIFNKHKYIKVYKFNENKTTSVEYHKIKDFKPKYLINPEHIFNSNGYQTIIITSNSAENINPLDFKSRFSQKRFQIAIENKLLKDAFGQIESNKIDLMKVALFANLFITIILLFILMKQNGAV